MMVCYEIKKVFSRMSSKIALAIIFVTVAVTCWFAAAGVSYIDEKGEAKSGISAIRKVRERKKEWAGPLTEEKIAAVISENARIDATVWAQSKDFRENDIAYGWKQGFSDIRSLIIKSYGDFNTYDSNIMEQLSPEDAGRFYENRLLSLEKWLKTDAKDIFTDREKQFLKDKYRAQKVPFVYDYMEGWVQALQYAPTVIMITLLVLGFLTANIFSGEFTAKADAVFFSSYHGRKKAVSAKIKAGVCIVTGIYCIVMFIYTVTVLLILGADGAGCPIQASLGGWKSFYELTNLELYALVVAGGYIGCLFLTLLTMLVSAKLRSAVVAVMVPFAAIFLPSFFNTSKILGLLPDQLLQMNMVAKYFHVYDTGGSVLSAAQILPILYAVLAAVIVPVLYGIYRRSQIR